MTVGILVHGDNHFIVRGPRPNRETALSLAKNWSLIRIGWKTPPDLSAWEISTREYRENLSWAVIVPGSGPRNRDVSILLDELDARGVRIDDYT